MLHIQSGASRHLMVSEFGLQAITSVFDSYWVPHLLALSQNKANFVNGSLTILHSQYLIVLNPSYNDI